MVIGNPLAPLPIMGGTIPNIQAFTIREGSGFLKILNQQTTWINGVLVPFVNENVNGLDDKWVETANKLIADWTALSDALVAQVTGIGDGMEADVAAAEAAKVAAEAARDLAQQYAAAAEDVQDSAVLGLLQDEATASRQYLDSLYASASELEALATILDSGRLSPDALTERFGLYVTNVTYQAFVTATNLAIQNNTTALSGKAAKSVQDTVETGRLSAATLDGRFQLINDALALRPIPVNSGVQSLIPNLAAGWERFDNNYAPPTYEVRDGIVYLEGLIKSGTSPANGTTLFTLPVGVRPKGQFMIALGGANGPGTNTTGLVDFLPNGVVRAFSGVPNGYLSLHVSFVAATA
jgi:hypothetical protein